MQKILSAKYVPQAPAEVNQYISGLTFSIAVRTDEYENLKHVPTGGLGRVLGKRKGDTPSSAAYTHDRMRNK